MARSARNTRDIGGSGNIKPIPIHVWIPPVFNAVHKIIVDNGTTLYDVTDLVTDAEFTMTTTDSVGEFSITVDNSAEQYTDKFSGWNKVYLYIDYGSEATTKVFTGMIERPSKSDNKIILTGQSSATRFVKKFITYSATDKSRSEILKEIIEANYTDLSISGIEDNLETATVNYTETYFMDIIIDLCGNDYDGYVDENFIMQYFSKGSRINETEAVVHDYNLLSVGDFCEDLELVSNKTRVYGKDKDGLPVMYTASDESSIVAYDERAIKLELTSYITEDEVKRVAEYESSNNGSPSTIGTIKSLLLPTIKPGQKLKVSDPQNGLEPKEYPVYKIVHTFSNDEPPMTEITIEKESASLSKYVSGTLKYEIVSSNRLNPLGLDYSHVIDFSDLTIGTFNNTEIISERSSDDIVYYLENISGNTGNWISNSISLNTTPSIITFKLIGDNLDGTSPEGTKIEYSFDGGNTYYTWTEANDNIFSTSEIIIRVTLSSEGTKLKYIGILYS